MIIIETLLIKALKLKDIKFYSLILLSINYLIFIFYFVSLL